MIDLVADIGGTNTRLALVRDGQVLTHTEKRYVNADHSALWPIITDYMRHHDLTRTNAVCVCAAGPVHDGAVTLTNLAWTITGPDLQRTAGADQAFVLNDLAAQGYALSRLPDTSKQVVMDGPQNGSRRLVIGLGTGVNAAVIHGDGGRPFVVSSESGHICLPTPTPDLVGLRDFITHNHGFASVEEVLSGRGVSACYDYAAHRAGAQGQLTPSQVLDALRDNSPIATECIKFYIQALAAFASDLALIHLPFGGISLIGGVARQVLPWMQDFGFTENFRNKGRFSQFLCDFRVDIITDDYAALSGCAAYMSDHSKM